MATTISLKNSVTTSNTPSSLAQGEVAINVTDKKVWVGNAATTPVLLVNGGSDGVFTSVTDSGLTNTRLTYAGTGGLLKDSASITTDGTTITAGGFSGPHNGTVGATTPNTGAFTTLTATNFNAASTFGFKNRVINGDMRIDQRNAGAAVTPTDGQYTLDRWAAFMNPASKYTIQQNAGSVTPPTGFNNYLGLTSSSAYSLSATDYFGINQYIEGLNIADLAWGTANAKTVTISFWVRSSLTGTFGGSLRNSAGNRSYPFTYTITTANTWEYETITIAGDTTGTWLTTNGKGVGVNFSVGTGSTYSGTAGSWSANNYLSATGAQSVVGTNGATFYITGVQLETGSTATTFDYRDYGRELILCQRYCASIAAGVNSEWITTAQCFTSSGAGGPVRFPVTMRTNPTVTVSAANNFSATNAGGGAFACGAFAPSGYTQNSFLCEFSTISTSPLTAGNASLLVTNTTSAKMLATAEL